MEKMHKVLEDKMCKELELIEEKYKGGAEMSEVDLKRVDMLAHALKSLATYKAMKEADEYGYEDGMSGRRGRNPYNGQYMSREGGSNQSYASGYGQGYSDAMSGHFPPYPNRW